MTNKNSFQKPGFWKKRSLGQNFLSNPHILDKIVTAAEISKDDIIIEVGPGPGILTRKIAEKAKRVFAIEKDHRLIPILQKEFENDSKIKIIEGDILKFTHTSFSELPEAGLLERGYKIVANIPYYITSNLLRTIFEEWPKPELIVLTIQKEVAQRIMAKPPHMNLLALSVQYYSDPEIIGYVSKNNFRPIPRVDSAIIKLTTKNHVNHIKSGFPEARLLEKGVFELMKIGFSEKRKQLAGILVKKLKLPKEDILQAFHQINIKENIRAENLTLEQWEKLSKYLNI